MTEENNRLYKKWVLIKKNENKQKILIERLKKINSELQDKKDLKRKTKKRMFNYETHTDTDGDILDIEKEFEAKDDIRRDKNDYFDESFTEEDEISIGDSELI
jgi:hypothetical protein